ncbi:ABC transporter substrate-binding protein [Paenibacillus sp. JMULE4]|uniref:ABC transporter substrate-binding protein n=1 Tax=Paenibacillus TaxID=44249 RepID=UPI00088AF4A9|nr:MULTISPECIES: ABC transporter substrate-binding protein [Paenibacillus]NTZ17993.1 ABC transporter substrate-binding protein [Paenibacillus sp. JMULE4]SDJ88702.1 ABC-type nitrate/sulfonate/bicarbonate transport system, substrate-binding protein [Paenibacillus naphthalenovorans]
MRTNQWILLILLSLGMILSGCGSTADSSQNGSKAEPSENPSANAQPSNAPKSLDKPVSIKIGYPTQGASMLPLWIAKDTGIFEKYGVKADLIYIAGTPKVQETLNSGAIQVGLTGVDPVGKAKAAGVDSVILSAVSDRTVLYIYGQKSAEKANIAKDLKGKTMITAAEGSLYDHLAKFFIKENGLTPKTDVKLLNMGGEGDRTAAFLKGEGAFYVAAPPTSFKMDEMGYPQLYDFKDKEVLNSGVVMLKDYYDKNPELANAVVASLIEANAYIVNHKEAAIKSISKWTGIDDPALAQKTYDVNVGTLPKKPYVSDKSVQFFLDNSDSEAVRTMKPSDIVDNSLVKALDESGWIDSLYKK